MFPITDPRVPHQRNAHSDIPTQAEIDQLGAVESVLMVGYPIGLWDSVNNKPIVRRGTTATHPAIEFSGRPEFLIDCACWPGSSGSPVVLYQEFASADRQGNINMGGTKMKLLGVCSTRAPCSMPAELRTRSRYLRMHQQALPFAFPSISGLLSKAAYLRTSTALLARQRVAMAPNQRMKLTLRAGFCCAGQSVTRMGWLDSSRSRSAAYARIRYAAHLVRLAS